MNTELSQATKMIIFQTIDYLIKHGMNSGDAEMIWMIVSAVYHEGYADGLHFVRDILDGKITEDDMLKTLTEQEKS